MEPLVLNMLLFNSFLFQVTPLELQSREGGNFLPIPNVPLNDRKVDNNNNGPEIEQINDNNNHTSTQQLNLSHNNSYTLNIGLHNINGIKSNDTKLYNLIDWCSEKEIDIMGITETNINQRTVHSKIKMHI